MDTGSLGLSIICVVELAVAAVVGIVLTSAILNLMIVQTMNSLTRALQV